MKSVVGVYGASGCGRGIMPLVRGQYKNSDFVFIDDGKAPGVCNGEEIVSWQQFLESSFTDKAVCLAIADPKVRGKLALKCDQSNIPLATVRAADVLEMDNVELSPGACLSPRVVFTSNIRVGRCFHANLFSYIEHDCVIGDFVTLAPRSSLNGNVTVGNFAYIGAGAIVKQGVNIGAEATVGMGAVVTKDVAPGAIVVGNPAKPMRK
jgi:sugar O-acyltransferase (sialic acid O-acetyltransferase NeuD family)